MRKVILVLSMVFLLVSFTNIDDQKVILKDIDGTLLESYAVVDKAERTVTFTVDANTTVSSSVIDGEFKIFLVENGTSSETSSYTLNIEGENGLSFDSYFEQSMDLAGQGTSYALITRQKPKSIHND